MNFAFHKTFAVLFPYLHLRMPSGLGWEGRPKCKWEWLGPGKVDARFRTPHADALTLRACGPRAVG